MFNFLKRWAFFDKTPSTAASVPSDLIVKRQPSNYYHLMHGDRWDVTPGWYLFPTHDFYVSADHKLFMSKDAWFYDPRDKANAESWAKNPEKYLQAFFDGVNRPVVLFDGPKRLEVSEKKAPPGDRGLSQYNEPVLHIVRSKDEWV